MDFALLSVSSTEMGQTSTNSPEASELAALGALPLILGIIMLVIGIAYLVVSYGLLKGKGWEWAIAIIASIIGLINQITSVIIDGSITSSILYGLASHIVGMIIRGVIIYYMFRPPCESIL